MPDSVVDQLKANGINASSANITHCKREMFQGVWKLMLDERFRHAYRHGVVVQCSDGIKRRLYPRIFTYSADYPEKCVYVSDNSACLR